jgi:hypothetical protein
MRLALYIFGTKSLSLIADHLIGAAGSLVEVMLECNVDGQPDVHASGHFKRIQPVYIKDKPSRGYEEQKNRLCTRTIT